eukprot:11210385-Alexandrium_andersonii.AAC.1
MRAPMPSAFAVLCALRLAALLVPEHCGYARTRCCCVVAWECSFPPRGEPTPSTTTHEVTDENP